MRYLSFKKMDAFTDGTASGNPAGCIYLDNDVVLSEPEMQRIARELKGFVNEVGYLSATEDGFRLKYYSSECEVDFCGHATIGIMYDLISGNENLKKRNEISIYVNAGRLTVFNSINEDNAVYIMAPTPQFIPSNLLTDEVSKALLINIDEIAQNHPLRIINAGLRTLIVPLNSLETCLGIFPDQEKLRLFCVTNDIDIILVFCKETSLPSTSYRTRVFAPKFGYLEDPATGSGNAAFGNYLIEQGLWEGNISIEQGPARETPNIIKLRRYSIDNQDYILFGGASVIRIDGKYVLQA